MDTVKKISFGFSKLQKKPNVIFNKSNEKKPEDGGVQLIQCLEENSIKLLNENKQEKGPLVIPMQESRSTSAALASLKLRQSILNGDVQEEGTSKNSPKSNSNEIDGNESLEKKAARELLEEIKNKKIEEPGISLTVSLKPDELPLDGAKEPSIEDYESIPISEYGLAMLRGMGWKDEEKKKSKVDDAPVVRPKGMGLGADKVLQRKPLLIAPEQNEKLEIKKNAFVRILAGKHKDMYGQIEGLDDHAGRVIIKLALGGNRESLNEFLVQPVSKAEYTKYGKVINAVKYEEYKKIQEDKEMKVKDEKLFKSEKDFKIQREKDEISRDKHEKYSSNSKRDNSEVKFQSSNRESSVKKSDNHRRQERRDSNKSTSSREFSEYRRCRKKSSKMKKEKTRDRSRRHSGSSGDDKRHKKKTKKSKKARSRSRGRR